MRAAALHLGFAGLHAESAVSGTLTGNLAAVGVSRRLGYQPNGLIRRRVRDALGHEQRFALSRELWQQHRTVLVEIDGLAPCLAQFGI
jgi:RimJ/RimL family protein N-acetyltransferase